MLTFISVFATLGVFAQRRRANANKKFRGPGSTWTVKLALQQVS